jgi:hypothetical protein
MKPIRCLHAALVAVLGLTAASCSKDSVTAPAPSSSALSPATRTGLATVQAALESDSWRSLDALSFAAGPAQDAGRVRSMLRDVVASKSPLASSAGASSLVRTVVERLAPPVAEPLAEVIPPEVRGTTFVFDADQHRYVPDPARAGAPGNGVRYILYAVNPLTHEPVVSEEIGYADLTDEGDATPATASLRLRAVSKGITFIDYTVALAAAPSSGALAVRGAFFDGRKHLTFAIQAHSERDEVHETLALEFHLAVPEDDFALANAARAQATPADNTLRVEQTIQIGGHTFVIASVQRPDLVDATIAVDGAPFALVHGEGSTLVVVRPDGQPLSAGERAALGHLLGLFDGVSRMLAHLLEPVGALFGLVPA